MMIPHTNAEGAVTMAKSKVAITLDAGTLRRLDRLVRSGLYPNRSQAVEAALRDTLSRLDRRLLAEECAKLEPTEEQALAEEGLAAGGETWPPY